MKFFHLLLNLQLLNLQRLNRLNQRRSLKLSTRLSIFLVIAGLFSPFNHPKSVQAQTAPYCQLSAEAMAQKDALRQAAISGDEAAQTQYRQLLTQQAQELRRCRSESWLKNQAIWLRVYPCDAKPGVLEAVLDQAVNRGYNQVYLEVFANGQVLLPQSENTTSWVSVLRAPGYSNRDLLAEAIAKGRERGLQVYAWMFTMNFGYTYTQQPGAEQILARNGSGQTSLTVHTSAGLNTDLSAVNSDETFIDPYNFRAKQDFYALVQAITRRRPDGILFDYIRYPRGAGSASVASRVQDLWIYGTAAQQALQQRALNRSGQDLIRRFASRGYITADDLAVVATLYPDEPVPQWQGITLPADPTLPPEQLQPYFQSELWRLSVAHAIQGVLDFLGMALLPAQRQGIAAGAVFFPDGNQTIGRGFDSRLQSWERFPANIEWHPMAYGTCGHAGCIVAQVERVVRQAPPGTQVMPVLAGDWGRFVNGRPALEAQMHTLHHAFPQITSISHFAYSWQFPQSDRERKFCPLS